jgi:hypothetical protein
MQQIAIGNHANRVSSYSTISQVAKIVRQSVHLSAPWLLVDHTDGFYPQRQPIRAGILFYCRQPFAWSSIQDVRGLP